MTRQSFLERKLEAARATGIPVGSVNLKVIDHWHKQGWYALFKSRYVLSVSFTDLNYASSMFNE